MKIPQILLGTGKEVHPKVSRLMLKIKKDAKWPKFADSEFVDTREMDNPTRILFQLDPALGAKSYFRLYSFSRYSKEDLGSKNYLAQRRVFFDGLVNSPWGVLALLCRSAFVPPINQDAARAKLFFRNLVQFWDTFIAEKALFYDENGSFNAGSYFWKNSDTQLWPLMYKAGVPKEVFEGIEWDKLSDYQARDWILEYILEP